MPLNKWDEEELAYLAGYVDGEGCFYVGQNHKICLTISNTHRPTVAYLKQVFGGNFSGVGHKRKEHHRLVYTWTIVAQQLKELLLHLLPYLKEKQNQAALLLVLQATKGKSFKAVSEEIKEERNRLHDIFKSMKHVET